MPHEVREVSWEHGDMAEHRKGAATVSGSGHVVIGVPTAVVKTEVMPNKAHMTARAATEEKK